MLSTSGSDAALGDEQMGRVRAGPALPPPPAWSFRTTCPG
jgi:hypothetical protein